MDSVPFQIETKKAFSESLIWQLNRDFYQETGIEAWSENIVPHHMTSNSKVGKTYAELIFALLKDRAFQGHINEPVYLLELGAGHGRLAFHILQHLENLLDGYSEILPPYCYILSDIVEDNLSFFLQHSQLDIYFQKGNLDVAFFDAAASEKIELRFSKKTILPKDLLQPILAIGNYFFDSIPTDLFYIENHELSACLLSIHSTQDPQGITKNELIKSLEFTYHKEPVGATIYEDNSWNEIMTEYKNTLQNTFLFFPSKALICLRNIQAFSQTGLVLLTMDKGFHELQDLDNKPKPDVITHGSMSLWVNYHAISEVCLKQKGTTFFPSQSNFHLEIGCLLFLEGNSTFEHTEAAYEHVVNTFGPDDFNS